MNKDVETRLRSADPLERDTPEQHDRDRRWLRARISAVATTSGLAVSRTAHRRTTLVAVAAAAAVLAGVGGAAIAGAFDSVKRQPAAEAPMEIAMAPDAPSMASCVPFSVETLAEMPVAFSGTVTEDDGKRVMIQVDRWYQGGDTDQVSLVAPDASMTSLDGMLDFEDGQRYLVTAGSGVVNYCGFSAVWSEQLANDFMMAFDAN